MKNNRVLKRFALCVTCIFGFTACNDNDGLHVSDSVQSAFIQKYGDVSGVEWERKQANYMVADFWQDGKELEAWFAVNEKWVLTEIDLEKSIDSLPEAVKIGFNATDNGKSPYRLDDIDQIVRSSVSDVFIIEVERPEAENLILHFNVAGELLEVPSDDYLAKYL